MIEMVFGLLGGIGLFLLGMILLTDGLREFAGESLKRALMQFTGTPLKAFASGTLVTAMVQSSSATTVAVIGFVSAGLLSFPQALGVVFGASLGTTGTGWIVAVLGLKISLGTYALAVVGAGAFLRLLGRPRWRPLGLALAGFGLIFIGISNLQEGMEAFSARVPVAELAGGGLAGHLLAMGVGILLTVVMQSSSAAVATTLTALHSGALSFEQAASLVIGAAIGTTVTALLASIGANIPAKRTALAFVLFNLATGLIAVFLLPLFLWLIGWAQRSLGLEPGAISLAAFHSLFIGLGVLLFLPWVGVFARLIERVLPDRGPALTRHLDRSLLSAPAVALEATRRALQETAGRIFVAVHRLLNNGDAVAAAREGEEIEAALKAIQEFLARIPAQSAGEPWSHQRTSLFHALDHLARCGPRLHLPDGVRKTLSSSRMADSRELLEKLLQQALTLLPSPKEPPTVAVTSTDSALPSAIPPVDDSAVEILEKYSRELAEERRQGREQALHSIPGGDGAEVTLGLLDGLRWVDRIGYHAWRATVHLLDLAAQPEEDFPLRDDLDGVEDRGL